LDSLQQRLKQTLSQTKTAKKGCIKSDRREKQLRY